MDRRKYEADESVIILYASLSCDLALSVDGQPPIAMNRPELTLVSIPKGRSLTIDVQGGVRQQRLFALFRHASLAKAFGLEQHLLPEALRDEAVGTAGFGRIVSIPLDRHVASLVADTVDSPLRGEMRALQYQGPFTRNRGAMSVRQFATRRPCAQDSSHTAGSPPGPSCRSHERLHARLHRHRRQHAHAPAPG